MWPPRALRAQPGPGSSADVLLPPSASPLPGEGSAESAPLRPSRCPGLPRLRVPGHYTEREEQTGLTAAGLLALVDNPGCCRREGAAGKAQHGAAEMCLLAPAPAASNYGAKGGADILGRRRRQLPQEEGSAPGRHSLPGTGGRGAAGATYRNIAASSPRRCRRLRSSRPGRLPPSGPAPEAPPSRTLDRASLAGSAGTSPGRPAL